MIDLKHIEAARVKTIEKGNDSKDLGIVVRSMPSAVRRMGLVRSLEWLEAGKKHSRLGTDLYANIAHLLLLPASVSKAVNTLETCGRRDLLAHHQRAIVLFDRLALLQRAAEKM